MSQASTIATLFASTGSIVGGGAGIWWVTKSINDASILEQQESRDDMPKTYTTLHQDTNFKSTYNKDKYGGFYGKYLVSTSNNTQNKDWWNWSFEKYKLVKPTQGKFANILQATGDDNSLESTCKNAYLQQYTDDVSNQVNVDYPESDIWKFCSIIGVKPVTLSEHGDHYGKGTRGAPENTKDRESFISVDSTRNKQFWEYQDKMLKASINENSDKFFYPLKSSKTIREICQMAFGTPVVPETGKNQDTLSQEIEKYCKLSNTNESLRAA